MSLFSRLIPRMQIPLPGANLITLLAVVMVVVQFLLDRAGGPEEASAYYFTFGLSWTCIAEMKFWQLVTHAFVHGSWFHLLVNLLMLWLVGGRVIHILGQKRFGVIVLVSIIAGGVFHLLADYLQIRNGYFGTQLVGMSGACLGLLITLTTLSPDSRMWPIPVSGKNLGLGLILSELLLWLMTPGMGIPVFSRLGELFVIWGGEGMFLISHACHLGGCLAGWFLARNLLAPTMSLEDLQRARARRETEMELGDAG